MKRVILLSLIFFITVGLFAQDKYAYIFSRPLKGDYPALVELNKEVSRNNINVISHALEIQRFKPAHITIDSSGGIRKNILSGVSAIVQNIRKGDFVFLYFDIPLVMDKESNEALFAFDNEEPEDKLALVELNQLLKKIVLKVDDASLFFTLIDAEIPAAMKMPEELSGQYILAGSPGEPNLLVGKNSAFSLAVEKALQSISSLNDSYVGFYNNIKRNLLLYTTQQNPVFISPDRGRPFFNNLAVKFSRHYQIVEKLNDSTVIINAGQRMNIGPGSLVHFYLPFSDTSKQTPVFNGVVTNSGSVSAQVKVNGKVSLENIGNWAIVSGNDVNTVKPFINFNETYGGDKINTDIFNNIIAELKKPGNNAFASFVKTGGDARIGNIVKRPDGNLEITILNPQTGQLLTTLKISSPADVKPITGFNKKLTQYEYVSALFNYIPELAVEFKMTGLDAGAVIEKENGYDILYEGDKVAIKITNPNLHALYYSLVDITQDKNFTVISGFDMADHVIKANSSLTLPVTISAPFGKERIKLFTSTYPFSLGNLDMTGTRSANAVTNFTEINIQDYDFESRSLLYAKSGKQKEHRLSIEVKEESGGNKILKLRNPGSERVYFNLFCQKADGSYETIFPSGTINDFNCYADYGNTANFNIMSDLQPFDQLIAVYADRPFSLAKLTGEEKTLNSLFAEIARLGRIPGTALNKIGMVQALYQPKNVTTMRDGENIFIKLITPKATNERGIIIPAATQQYEINGFALSADNKPVKALKINNELVNYDAGLKFFEHTVSLSYGINKVVIEAADDKGFTAVRILEFELKNNNTVAVSGNGKNYFLGIGIDQYKTWPKLNNAKNDVVKFSDLLKSRFGFDSTRLLLDDTATRKNIINSIREFLKKAGPNDNVVIYLSGHGNEDQLADGDYYFMPQEADADDVSSAVKSTDIIDNFKKIRAKRCLLIVDACYSGMITNSINASGQLITSGKDQQSPETAPCKWIITSGRATKVSDGTKEDGNSPFARVLINYLREHDDDASLKMPKLIEFLKDNVKLLSKQQEPLGLSIEGRGEWIFKKNDNK
ncbi:MAG TPA: C13 family peptidase [Chitinophagaceae bacterium]|nr:C13 family peptidase [Chitinophagaceae bacterium]